MRRRTYYNFEYVQSKELLYINRARVAWEGRARNAADRGKNREYEKLHKRFFTSKKYILRRYSLFFDGRILLRSTKGHSENFSYSLFFSGIARLKVQALALLIYKISLVRTVVSNAFFSPRKKFSAKKIRGKFYRLYLYLHLKCFKGWS